MSEAVRNAIAQLIEVGLVRDSGERRDGEVVWEATGKSRDPLYSAQVLEALEKVEDGINGELN